MIVETLLDEIALVTGATRGIGRAIAEELARQGAIVIGTATSSIGAADISNYLKSCRHNCGKGVTLNVNDSSACINVIQSIQTEFGNVSILINNAGITRDKLIIRMKQKEWDDVISTNLNAVRYLSRAVLRNMIKNRRGRIINITSVVGFIGNFGQTNYAAAKAGVTGMSKALAREVSNRNITVNCVAPGFIDTDMVKILGKQQTELLLKQIPLGRLGKPADVAHAVAFLASPAANYITGTTLHVNGGMYMN